MDRPEDGKIEVTPEMIEAGARALSMYRDEISIYSARGVVEDVFLAMLEASKSRVSEIEMLPLTMEYCEITDDDSAFVWHSGNSRTKG